MLTRLDVHARSGAGGTRNAPRPAARWPLGSRSLGGARSNCGWSALFPIVDAEGATEVCPLFFRLGEQNALARLCADARFTAIAEHRITATLTYADANEACNAAFVGGPVALAWSRFSDEIRSRVRARYVSSIEKWRHGNGFRIPGEFVIVAAAAPTYSSAIDTREAKRNDIFQS